jgi:hypothetical protein
LLAAAFPHWPVREFLTSASALVFTFIGTLSLWAPFAVGYLGAGRIGPPVLRRGDRLLTQWLDGASGRSLIAPSERDATRVLLTGRRLGRRLTRALAALGSAALCCYCLSMWRGNPVLNSAEERFFAVLIAYARGITATAAIRPMVGRARYLWLRTRLDRSQLFHRAEAEGWRMLPSVGVFALTISACMCLLAQVPWAIITETLLLSFMSAVALIYVNLLGTRKWPILHVLLLAPVLLLIPLLRTWARSRWTRIDWIINRPVRLPGGCDGI